MAVARESAGAEKHDDADHQHAQHSNEQNVSAFAMHYLYRYLFHGLLRFGDHRLPACGARPLAEHDLIKTEICARNHFVVGKLPTTAGWQPALPSYQWNMPDLVFHSSAFFPFGMVAACELELSGLVVDLTGGVELAGARVATGAEAWRVLMALNAMIPETATTCRTKTISNARDNFMFGSAISSQSAVAAIR